MWRPVIEKVFQHVVLTLLSNRFLLFAGTSDHCLVPGIHTYSVDRRKVELMQQRVFLIHTTVIRFCFSISVVEVGKVGLVARPRH